MSLSYNFQYIKLLNISPEQTLIRGKSGKTGKFLGYVLPAEELRELLESLFVFGKDNQKAFFWRMGILLVISTVICTSGLLSNSAAVVIGAMLVAPMMRPVMSSAAAITLSWPKRFTESLIMVFLMALSAVAISIIMTWFSPNLIELPQQVLDRTKPTLFDLTIALAAGCGGAYTMTRKEASAVPGVAMAVALLPPLASCGALLVYTEYDMALRAFVLFFVNYAAMVLAGALTFRAVGVKAKTNPAKKSIFFKGFLLLFTFVVVIVSVPLYFYSHEVWYNAMYQAEHSQTLQAWLKKNQLKVESVDINKRRSLLYLHLTGPTPPLNIEELYNGIKEVRLRETGRTDPFKIDITWSQTGHFSWPPEMAKKKEVRKLKQDYRAVLKAYTWRWIGSQYANGSWLHPASEKQVIIRFLSRRRLEVLTSCRKALGEYELSQEDIDINIDMPAIMRCKDSKIDRRFALDINSIANIDIQDNRLALRLDNDSGVMYFEGIKKK